MRLRRTRRLITTLFAGFALLFSQLVLANYVCPGQGSEAMAEMMASGAPCEGMDAAQPVLCHQHAAGAAQSAEAAKLPVASLPMILQVLAIPPVPDLATAEALPRAARGRARPPPDPIFLATLRLRV